MTSGHSVRVDHDEVNNWISRSDALHDEYNETLGLLDEVVTDVVAEASKFTESGGVSPIFSGIVTQVTDAVGHLKTQIVKHQTNMKQDTATLRDLSDGVRDAASDAASLISRTNHDVSI